MEILRVFQNKKAEATCHEVYKDDKNICRIFFDPYLRKNPSKLETGITTLHYHLFSDYNLSSTLAPGKIRSVRLFDTQDTVANIVYNGSKNYSIVTHDTNITVTVDDDGYYFTGPDGDIGALLLNEHSRWFPENNRSGLYERSFTCVLFQQVDEITQGIISAFHYLKFGF